MTCRINPERDTEREELKIMDEMLPNGMMKDD